MKEQLQLHTEFRDKQEKYVYYIVALCVTAIGFSVLQTRGRPLTTLQIPLGLAVLSWSISIYCGLQFIGNLTASIYRNSMYMDMMQGRDPIIGTHPERMEYARKAYHEGSEKLSQKATTLHNTQERLFYLGIACFLVWHILEMYYTKTK